MESIKRLIYGVIARFINIFIQADDKVWIFSSSGGKAYKDSPKYLLEYMLREHPEYKCFFISSTKSLCSELKDRNIPCLYLYSLRGVFRICSAGCVFYSHSIHDLFYHFKKKNRRFIYLIHGQPLKIASLALQKKDYWETLYPTQRFVSKIREIIRKNFITDAEIIDTEFTSACSDFLKPYLEKDQDYKVPVKILGMPRNDGLFDDSRMKKEEWLQEAAGKFVITYMPTHRMYGQGEITPTPFINDEGVQKWFKENNVLFLMKQHPNMLTKMCDFPNTETIKDITKSKFDPQVCIYHSDVLITDFSSVWMDYLLLKRPCIFYIYDDFEKVDAGCHYDIREDPPGHFCYSEKELFELIKLIKLNYDKMRPSDRIVYKYHKYVDGNSCKRYFDYLTSE